MSEYLCFNCKKYKVNNKSYMYKHLCKNVKCSPYDSSLKYSEDELIKYSLIPTNNLNDFKIKNDYNVIKTSKEFIDELIYIYKDKLKTCRFCNTSFDKYSKLSEHHFNCVRICNIVQKNNEDVVENIKYNENNIAQNEIKNKLENEIENENKVDNDANNKLINELKDIVDNELDNAVKYSLNGTCNYLNYYLDNSLNCYLHNNLPDAIINNFKKINLVRSTYYIEKSILFHLTKNNEILKLNKNVKDIDNGYIYLIILREFYNQKQEIYKIGKSTKENNKRVRSYPKGSILLLQVYFKKCSMAENILKIIFKNIFIQERDIGTEFFSGDFKLMKNYINTLSEMDKFDLF